MNFFGLPSPISITTKEIHQAQLDLLQAEASREYHTAMAEMLRTRLVRLRARLAELKDEARGDDYDAD